MGKKKKGLIFSFLGGIFLLLSIFLDVIRSRPLVFGPTQMLFFIVSLLIIYLGLFILFNRDITVIQIFTALNLGLLYFEQLIQNHSIKIKKTFHFFANSKIQDMFFVFSFFVLSILYTLGRWNGNIPFIYLGSDASTIASFAAALDNPINFINDFMLNPLSNNNSYIALHIPLLRVFENIVGGYGEAFLVFLPITIFLKLYGFYSLGKFLFKKSSLGFFLAICTYPVIYTGVWDYWGLLGDSLPRNFFEILFPWLIIWSIQWNDKPKKWIFFSISLGLFTYVHSISAVIIFSSVWIALLLTASIPFKKKLILFLINSSVYFAFVLPFIIGYFGNIGRSDTIDYDKGLRILQSFYSSHLDIPAILSNLISQIYHSGILLFFVWSIVLLIFTWDKQKDKSAFIIMGWIAGILCSTLLISAVEQKFEQWLHILPIQMFLVRGIRYLPPLLIIMIFLSLTQIHSTIRNTPYPMLMRGFVNMLSGFVLISLLFLTITRNQQGNYAIKEVLCLSTGHLTCQTQQEIDAIDLVKITQQYSKVGEVFLTLPPLQVKFERSLRYEGLRPLGYNFPDSTRILDLQKLEEINEILDPWNRLEHAPEETKLKSYLNLAKQMRVDLLIIQLNDFPNINLNQMNTIYTNSSYALVRIN